MPAGRPRADRIDLSQPVIAGFFSQAGGARAPARPVLQRKDGEATGAQVASATAGNLVTLDPATETLGKWVARQAALRGFPSRQNYGTERNRALIALYEAEVVADADRAIPMARIRQQAVEDEARMYAEKREALRRETEEATAAAAAALAEAAAQGAQEALPGPPPALVVEVEAEAAAERDRELLREAVEEDEVKRRKRTASQVFARDVWSGPPRYLSVTRGEVEKVASLTMFTSSAAAHDDGTFCPPREELDILDAMTNEAANKRLRATITANPWLQCTALGIHCRCCSVTENGQGQLRRMPVPWAQVEKRLDDRVRDHLARTGTRLQEAHSVHWSRWLQRWRDGASAVHATAGNQALKAVFVAGVLNTQQIVQLVHHIVRAARENTAKRSVSDHQAHDALFCDEARERQRATFNLTSPTVHDTLLRIVEEVVRARLKRSIRASRHVALIFDEARHNRRHAMYAMYIRWVSAISHEPVESLWRVAEEPAREGDDPAAMQIARHVIRQYDLGEAFWATVRAMCTDGCNLMKGAEGGVQRFLRGWMCPFALWVWCQAHSLNIQAIAAASAHAHINEGCTTLGAVFRFFYRGHFVAPRRKELSAAQNAAIDTVGSFAYWRELEVPEIGDTRWVSHEGAALVVTRMLPGLVGALRALRPKMHDPKDLALADVFNNATKIYPFFLLAAVCPLLRSFSRVLQSPKLCLGDAVGIRDWFLKRMEKLGAPHDDLREKFPVYFACWDVITKAGVEGATRASFVQWHETVARPYVATLCNVVGRQVAAADVFKHFGAFDPRSRAFTASVNADGFQLRADGGHAVLDAIDGIAEWLSTPKLSLAWGNPNANTPAAFPPRWGAAHVAALSAEINNVLLHIHARKTLKTLTDVLAEFRRDAVRVEFPSMAALMDLIAAMPLTSCSAERIFSKMRLVGSRLRKLLKEPELNRLLFVGVETPWDEGRGIPTDVMDDIISAWICANGTASGERKLMCVPLQRYLDCVTAARRWRDHEQRTRAALATISTQTDESPPVLVPNLAQAALNPEPLIF
jgi:hypothetical protein